MKISKEKLLSIGKHFAVVVDPHRVAFHSIYAKMIKHFYTDGPIPSKLIEEWCKKEGVKYGTFRRRLWLLKQREVLTTEFDGMPQLKGKWLWDVHPEFSRLVKYLGKIL